MIDSSKKLATGYLHELVSIGGDMKITEMIAIFNELVKQNVPDGKSETDFTGGYVQQLANNNQLVLYFGYKQKYDEEKGKVVNTKNKATTILNIDYSDVDMMYVGLKAKVTDMRLNDQKRKHKTVSLSSFMNCGNVKQESLTELPAKIGSDIVSEEAEIISCHNCNDLGCSICC